MASSISSTLLISLRSTPETIANSFSGDFCFPANLLFNSLTVDGSIFSNNGAG